MLVFTGGPAPCTSGNGPIIVSDVNSESFNNKWNMFDEALKAGTPSSLTLTESEVTSRANKFIQEKGGHVSDVQVCFHNGFGEVTGNVDAFLGSSNFKVKGTVSLTAGHPVVDFQEVEVGNVPGFVLTPLETLVNDAMQSLLDNLRLKHTYTVVLADGQAQITGSP